MFGSYDFAKNYPNGDRYKGEAIENGLFHGKGTFTWGATGNRYTGQWVKGKMHGDGVYADAREGWTYTGRFQAGRKGGKGEVVWRGATGVAAAASAAGDVTKTYKGDWRDDHPHGSGTETIVGRLTYTGDFARGVYEGTGTATYHATGDTYRGSWADGAWHGSGVLETAAKVYDGTFQAGAATGHGRLVTKTPEAPVAAGADELEPPSENAHYDYTGDVLNLVPQGKGKIVYRRVAVRADADVDAHTGSDADAPEHYEGDFENGERTGYGDAWVDGDWRYTGCWLRNRKQGHGKLTTPTYTYQGEFVADQQTGHGAAEALDGTWEYKGMWRSDVYHGQGVLQRAGLTLLTPDVATGDMTVSNSSFVYDGAFVDGEQHGRGRMELSSKYVYSGDFAHGEATGAGTLTAPNGRTYEGGFAQWYFEGAGSVARDTHSYRGGFAGGRYNGHGRLNMANGDYYEGGFRDNVFHGHGTWYEAATSDTYEGEWDMGCKKGQGIEVKYSVYHYTGGFKDNEKDGYGTIKFSSGDAYAGGFLRSQYHGRGVLTFANGSKYEGEFRQGKRQGRGEEVLQSGATYTGDYVADVWHGHGVLTSAATSDRYEGAFVNGKKHGPGTYFYKEGARLSCHWVDDQLHGEGEYHFAHECKPPTLRTYHQGVLVAEQPYVYAGTSRNVLPPPSQPQAHADPVKAAQLGTIRTQTAADADYRHAATSLDTQLAALEAQLAQNVTPMQSFALKKQIAVVRAAKAREERRHREAVVSGTHPGVVQY